jgi:uncharacterized protein
MKYLYLLVTVILINVSPLFSQQKAATEDKIKPENKIKQYWFVMLVEGKNRSQDSATAAKIQEGHMANMNRLYYEGKLKVAGPFGDNGNWKGIFIFDLVAGCTSKEELEKLLTTDPAIASGRLAYEIHPWWTASTGSFVSGLPNK